MGIRNVSPPAGVARPSGSAHLASMHRTRSQRVAALLFAVWFALAGVKPGSMDTCPEHGGTHGSAGSAPVSSHVAGMADAHAMHAGHSMAGDAASGESATGSTQQHSEHHKSHCTCAGSCCCAPALELSATAPRFARTVAPTVAPQVPVSVSRAGWTDFILPFPTAPPHGHSA